MIHTLHDGRALAATLRRARMSYANVPRGFEDISSAHSRHASRPPQYVV
jgi:hypothetical protein